MAFGTTVALGGAGGTQGANPAKIPAEQKALLGGRNVKTFGTFDQTEVKTTSLFKKVVNWLNEPAVK